jgi:hypothetical protein
LAIVRSSFSPRAFGLLIGNNKGQTLMSAIC